MIEVILAMLGLGAMATLWWSLSPASDPAARRTARWIDRKINGRGAR